ncbi:hypothetical protein SAMN05421799_1312 [Alicyclobacillus vulcanalis]|uniref:Uncharacterized protein n=1 Tax=Alicyclobacillus vulcanalis TaxID=252246 RepID=A0A1N7PYQ4_9BACL|nr:hypothetical protein SAMN05421799_1312 [Alicyclobacillus vulcanalis]
MLLCKHLKNIVYREIERGNEPLEVENWSNICLNVRFKYKFDKINTKEALDSVCLKKWENTDSHYTVEQGIMCLCCSISVSFPLEQD